MQNQKVRNHVMRVIDSWLDYTFGPLYHIAFRIRFSQYCNDVYELVINDPQTFYMLLVKVLGSELLANSFLATLIAFSRKLGMNNPPTSEELISWFKGNEKDKVVSFINHLAKYLSKPK